MRSALGRVALVLVAGAAAIAGCGGSSSKRLNTAPASGPARIQTQLYVRRIGEDKYHTTETVDVGTPVQFRLHAFNAGGSQATGVRVTDRLPAGASYVPASAFVRDSSVAVQNGDPLPDSILTTGANLGPRPPGASFDVELRAKVVKRPPGGQMRNVVVLDTHQTGPVSATATVKVR